MKTLVIAFGGNAISPPDKRESQNRRLKRLQRVVACLKPLTRTRRLLFTHGNGADVGNLLLCQEALHNRFPVMGLDTLGAMTQGQLGYWLAQTAANELGLPAVSVVTRVEVDPRDPGILRKTKPIGPFYRQKVLRSMVWVKKRGFRRIVASPRPLRIVEEKTILRLFRSGCLVIAGGGGGVPVIRRRGKIFGVEGVIDKDLVAARLARTVKADTLLILTNVAGVYLGFGTPDARQLSHLNLREAQKYLSAGEFGAGSMGPKVEAAIDFLKGGGKTCYIGPWEDPLRILKGKRGTVILR